MTEKNLPGDGSLVGFKNYFLQFIVMIWYNVNSNFININAFTFFYPEEINNCY